VKAFILDASLAIVWFFPDEQNEPSAMGKRSLFDEHVALVPTIWRGEIVNFVARQHIKGRISAAQAAEMLHQLAQLRWVLSMIPRQLNSSRCRLAFS